MTKEDGEAVFESIKKRLPHIAAQVEADDPKAWLREAFDEAIRRSRGGRFADPFGEGGGR